MTVGNTSRRASLGVRPIFYFQEESPYTAWRWCVMAACQVCDWYDVISSGLSWALYWAVPVI